jgi:hypothetical protein
MADNLGTAAYKLVLDAREFNSSAVTSGKQMRDVQQVMRQTTTPAEKMAASYDSVTAAYQKGEIPLRNYQRYLDQLNTSASKNQQAVAAMRDGINQANQSLVGGIPVVGKYLTQIGKIHPAALAATAGVGLLAAAVGTTIYKVRQEMQELDEAGKKSRTLGLAPDEMLGMQYAAERAAGMTAEKFATSMIRVNHVTQQAAEGIGEASRAFTRLGLDAEKVAAAKPADRIRMIADAFKAVPDAGRRASIAMDLFGRGGAEMANFLSQGSDAIDGLTDRWERLTGLGGLDTKAIERANDALADVQLTIKSIFTRIAVDNAKDLAVAFEMMADHAMKLAAAGEGATSQRWVPWLANMAQVIGDPASAWFTESSAALANAGTAGGEAFSGNFNDAVTSGGNAIQAWLNAHWKPMAAVYDLFTGTDELAGEQIQNAADAREAAAQGTETVTEANIELAESSGLAEEAVSSLTARYQDQIDTFGMAAREAEIFRLQQQAMTDADQEQVEALRELDAELQRLEERERQLTEQRKEEEQRQREADKALADAQKQRERIYEQAARAMDRFATPEERYAKTVQELIDWLNLGAISLQDFLRAKEAAAAELGKNISLGKVVTAEEGERFGSAESIRNFYASRMGGRDVSATAAEAAGPVQQNIDQAAAAAVATANQAETGWHTATESQIHGMVGGIEENELLAEQERTREELTSVLDSLNATMGEVAVNTRNMAQDPGRVHVVGSL